MNEIAEKRSRLRAWLEQRRLHREVSNNGDRVQKENGMPGIKVME